MGLENLSELLGRDLSGQHHLLHEPKVGSIAPLENVTNSSQPRNAMLTAHAVAPLMMAKLMTIASPRLLPDTFVTVILKEPEPTASTPRW